MILEMETELDSTDVLSDQTRSVYNKVYSCIYANVLCMDSMFPSSSDRSMPISIQSSEIHGDNPFQHGVAVTGKGFVGREDEIQEALTQIRKRKSIVVYSDRKMGKSSFLLELAQRNSREFVFTYIDLLGMVDHNQFLESIAKESLRSSYGKSGILDQSIWELLRSMRLKLAALESGVLEEDEKHGEEVKNAREIKMCPRCGKPLKWVEKYSRSYCYACKKYAPKHRRVKLPVPVDVLTQTDSCPVCRDTMEFVEKYSEHYCSKCQRYPLVLRRKENQQKFTNADMIEALDLPQQIANQMGKQHVVMFDDFQEAAQLDYGGLLKTMNERFQEHKDVCYVFSGSRTDQLQRLFEAPYGAFHKFAHPMVLGPIDESRLRRFLVDRFRSAGGELTKEAARRIAAISGGCPSYAQQIGHELFQISKSPSPRQVEIAVQYVLNQNRHSFALTWDSIRSPLHRRHLVAMAKEPLVPHGADFVHRHGLKSRSHVQRIEKQLQARGIIRDGEIVDPLFVRWLRTRVPSK